MRAWVAWVLFVPAVVGILRISQVSSDAPGVNSRSFELFAIMVCLFIWNMWKDKYE